MKRFMAFLLAMFFFSCNEEEIGKELKTVESDLLIVECVLTNEKKSHKIQLSHPYQQLNGEQAPASGAVVTIIDGDENVFMATEIPAGSGEYFTVEMTAVFGKPYLLLVQYQGKEFFAWSGSVPVEPMDELQYDNAGEELYVLQPENSGENANYIDYYVTWKDTPFCNTSEVCEARLVHYDLKTIDVNSLFKPDKEDFIVPLGSIVIRRKYSLNSDYKNFLRAVLSETEWRGGAFDVQRENVPTNLSAGAAGYFAVSTVLSDTTVISEKP